MEGAGRHAVGGFGGLGAEQSPADIAAAGEQFPPHQRRAFLRSDLRIAPRRLAAFVVIEIRLKRGAPLLKRGQAGGAAALVARGGKNRQQDREQNRNDGDADQELDEGEPGRLPHGELRL